MIKQTLAKYLIERRDYPGPAAELFDAMQTVNGKRCRNRNDVRRWIRDEIGAHCYAGRIPQKAKAAASAIVLRTIGSDPQLSTRGELGSADWIVQVECRARGTDADRRAATLAFLVRMAFIDYVGWMGETWIQNCEVARQGEWWAPPSDASDEWPITYTLELSLGAWLGGAVQPVEPEPVDDGGGPVEDVSGRLLTEDGDYLATEDGEFLGIEV